MFSSVPHVVLVVAVAADVSAASPVVAPETLPGVACEAHLVGRY